MTKKVPDVEARTVTFDFEDGGETAVFDLAKCSEEMILQLALHGASQKLGDSFANTKEAIKGTKLTPAEYARARVDTVRQAIYDGEWSVRGEGTGGITDLARAISEVTGAAVEDVQGKLNEMEKDAKSAYRKHPDVAAVLARIRRERAEAKEKELAAKAGSGPDLGAVFA